MNGFIGALAAQLALKPVSPAADGIAPRPSRDHASAGCEPAADGPRAPGGPHVNAPPHPADGLGRGTVGTSMLLLVQPKGGFAGDMLPRCVIGRSGMAAYARELYSPEASA